MAVVTGYNLQRQEATKIKAKASPKQSKTEAQKQLAAEAKKRLARAFETEWKRCGGPELETEVRFHPFRKWRLDYALSHLKVAIEVEGAVWVDGRHTRGSGFIKDCIKYNSATLMGYRVFRLTEELINDPDHLIAIRDFILKEMSELKENG